MKRILALALPLALVACSAPQMAAMVTPAVLSSGQVTTLRQTCQIAGPALAVAAQPTMPAQVSETALPAAAYCQQLNAGILPATTDSNTPTWLPKVIRGVQIAAEVARVALPLLLPLL